jgi:hypothetical protein
VPLYIMHYIARTDKNIIFFEVSLKDNLISELPGLVDVRCKRVSLCVAERILNI